MRWFHLTVIGLFAAAALLFTVQNFQMVSVDFLRLSARAPLALWVVIAYLLGLATGGSLTALLRHTFDGARKPTEAPRGTI
jgi:uncharacterized integral membrane protein